MMSIESKLDSMVFMELPEDSIADSNKYRNWLLQLEFVWMAEFNSGNGHYRPAGSFNIEAGIGGRFGNEFISHSKLYRYDGTEKPCGQDDYRAKRGLLIRDHYSIDDVKKVRIIANNLEAFLKQKGIAYKRTDFKRGNRPA